MSFVVADRVKETSTTTGTGDFTLAGASTAHRAFSSVCSVGDKAFYCIQAVDSSGAPTGAWEVGYGTYSAANTLSRSSVLASSNSNLAVNFSAGNKEVFLTAPASHLLWMREKLSGSRTYYVATTGSDTANDGLSSGAPFRNIQKAVDVASELDTNGYTVTVNVAAGTYTENVVLKSITGGGLVQIIGAGIASTTLSPASGNAFDSSTNGFFGVYSLQSMKLTASGGVCINNYGPGIVKFQSLDFGASAVHISATYSGAVTATGNYTISGGAQWHARSYGGAMVVIASVTINVSVASLAFSQSFLLASRGGAIQCNAITFTGNNATVTGTRYLVMLCGNIDTQNSGASYLPGNAAGISQNGGEYY